MRFYFAFRCKTRANILQMYYIGKVIKLCREKALNTMHLETRRFRGDSVVLFMGTESLKEKINKNRNTSENELFANFKNRKTVSR